MGGKGVKSKGNVNAKTMCKLDHLKNLAMWTTTEAYVPSLGAFFGQQLAATVEALGLRADTSMFVCERCESILQPGRNCTIRIEKNKSKMRNDVVYRCHSCSHGNMMRGTRKGYVKEMCPSNAKPPSESEPVKSGTTVLAKGTTPPSPAACVSLLGSKRRKRTRSAAKKVAEPENSSAAASSKRKRSWTSLKEIAQSNEHRNKFTSSTIPFVI